MNKDIIIINKGNILLQNNNNIWELINMVIDRDNIINILKDKYLIDIDNPKISNNAKFIIIKDGKLVKIDSNKYQWFNISNIIDNECLNISLSKSIIKFISRYAIIDNTKYEKELYQEGYTLIAGVDEVGRGPLVGPVVTAAVVLPKNYELKGLTDSKKLSEKKRNEFYHIIMNDAIAIGIGIKEAKIIDEVNIYEATKLAMYEAINNLKIKPEYILIDAMKLDLDIPNKSIIKGDLRSISIAAASVIAKVTRDSMMYELNAKYPEYGFDKHKGYPTKEHIKNIKKFGLLDNYRFTFAPISDLIKKGGKYEQEIRKTNI